MKLLISWVTLLVTAVVSLPTPQVDAQTPMRGVIRDGNTVRFSGTVIRVTSDSVSVDAGFSAYRFPIQQRTRIVDRSGQPMSINEIRAGQSVTVSVEGGDNVVEIRSGELEMTLQPLESFGDMPGAVTIGRGNDAITVWTGPQTVAATRGAPGPEWGEISAGASERRVQDLLGEPGLRQAVGDTTIWWYRYTNGAMRLVAFRAGRALEWKSVSPGGD